MKNPYDLQNYELIHVMMKAIVKGKEDVNQRHLKWSDKRNSYFYAGRVVTFEVKRKQFVIRDYPKPGRLCLVPTENWEAFTTCEESDQEMYTINILMEYIDYIILTGSSFHLFEGKH